MATLGLATGQTPIPVYERLVAAHRAGDLSFEDVTTFNLDEYYPMAANDPQSYRAYMHRHLLSMRSTWPPTAPIVPDGTVPEAFLEEHGASYDRWIAEAGGLDLQLLGLGRNGHIGFNEPSDLDVDRRPPAPDPGRSCCTRRPSEDAAGDFGGVEHVPSRALTMGTASILGARLLLVLAFGAAKAEAVARSLRGPIDGRGPRLDAPERRASRLLAARPRGRGRAWIARLKGRRPAPRRSRRASVGISRGRCRAGSRGGRTRRGGTGRASW